MLATVLRLIFLNLIFFDAGGPHCHFSLLYCVLADFHMSTDNLVHNILLVF